MAKQPKRGDPLDPATAPRCRICGQPLLLGQAGTKQRVRT